MKKTSARSDGRKTIVPSSWSAFGEISVEILSEMFALSLFDGVSAEFNGLKVA
jgi:hypothetical protein